MKTVQLLYSYLLVEKPFSLQATPDSPTKEKRFSYNLYLDLIYLLYRIASLVKGKNNRYPLLDSRFILRIDNDDKLKSLKAKYAVNPFPFADVEKSLAEMVKESLLFREYEKNQDNLDSTDRFWENVFNAIVILNPELNKLIQRLPDYSLSGTERAKELMEDTFRNYYATKENVDDALLTLRKSMETARDLYMRLLALPVELTRLRLNQLETNRRKYLATSADLNPNMRFVNNRIPELIAGNPMFDDYVEKHHLSWTAEDPELLDLILKNILESDLYKKYESLEHPGIEEDSEFWRNVLVDIILNDPHFLEFLENKSVFWNDDLEIMASFVIKTLKRFEHVDTLEEAVMPMYKDGENGKDARFGAELFNLVVKNKEKYRGLIDKVLSHDKWETDRLAFMDIVITMTALAEIINYPEIPLQVSVNEYIEIAKSYSSARSGQFVNGLISSLMPVLQEQGLTFKS